MILEILSLYAWASLLSLILYPLLRRHRLPRSTACFGPLGLLIIAAAAKVAKGLADNRSKHSQGKEAERAARETHLVSEAKRGDHNAASQAMLRGLFGGRYAMPEDVFANINAPRAFTGIDPTKGSGWDLAGQGAGAVGDAALMAYGAQSGGASPALKAAGGAAANDVDLNTDLMGGNDLAPNPFPAPPVAAAPTGSVGTAGVAGEQFELDPWRE